jgi:peptide/nickel transport system substrate-binding protein
MDNDREIDRLKGDLSAARVSRRAFLARAAALGLSASATGVLLDACGGSLKAATSAPTSGLPTTSGVGTPVRGGTLTVGAVSGGSAETLNPVLVVSDIDVLRSLQLFDTLFVPSGDLQELIPRLALSAEPNRDASVWTVKLRDGVTWHDGRPFTADDVLYTLRLWASPKSNLSGLAGNIDTQRLRKRGDLVAEVPLRTPDAQWPTTVTLNPVVQNGTAFNSYNTRPIGTGPFKFQSFTPGKQSVFVANHDYWEHGKPYLDRLVFNSSFTDENARLNALLGGSIDVLFSSPFRAAQTQRQRGAVTVFGSPSPRAFLFVTRVDKGPFADPRVTRGDATARGPAGVDQRRDRRVRHAGK